MNDATIKRLVYSTVYTIYDPMEIITCLTLIVEILLQEEWWIGRDRKEPRVKWDDQLPPNVWKRWHEFVQQIQALGKLRIPIGPRPASFHFACTNFQLQTYCEASSLGYSAIVYVRTEFNSNINIAFIRARVAQVSQLTITRMALLNAFLSYRLSKKEQLGYPHPQHPPGATENTE